MRHRRLADRTTGRAVDDSPLHDVHVAAGRSFTDFAGWQMPVRYSSDLAEHHAVRTAAGLFDLSPHGRDPRRRARGGRALPRLRARGQALGDRGRAGEVLAAARRDGGIIDDLVVYRTRRRPLPGRGERVATARSSLAALRDRARRLRRALVDDESDDIALIALQGPDAAGDPRRLVDARSPRARRAARRRCRYYRALRRALRRRARAGRPHRVHRRRRLRALRRRRMPRPALWEALAEAGAALGLVPPGLASRDTLRLEAGMPLYGHELGARHLPGAGRPRPGRRARPRRATSSAAPPSRRARPTTPACSSASSPRASAPAAPATTVLDGDGRSSAWSPAAPCRRPSATRSPWPTSTPRSRPRHRTRRRRPRHARPRDRRRPALLQEKKD